MPTNATRDDLLGYAKRRTTSVEIDGKTFYIQSMTATEWLTYTSQDDEHRDETDLLIHCLVDDQGNKLLTIDDAEIVKQFDSRIVTELMNELWRHNSFSKSAIEEQVKNSSPTI